jgi:hypothetical protein
MGHYLFPESPDMYRRYNGSAIVNSLIIAIKLPQELERQFPFGKAARTYNNECIFHGLWLFDLAARVSHCLSMPLVEAWRDHRE